MEGLQHPQGTVGITQHPAEHLHAHMAIAGHQGRGPRVVGDDVQSHTFNGFAVYRIILGAALIVWFSR